MMIDRAFSFHHEITWIGWACLLRGAQEEVDLGELQGEIAGLEEQTKAAKQRVAYLGAQKAALEAQVRPPLEDMCIA
jgi:hypothetical protein